MTANRILHDSCHVFHLGWGIDLAASGIVLCAKLGIWPGRALNDKLKAAFGDFLSWCTKNHRVTAIGWWSYQKFDMSTSL